MVFARKFVRVFGQAGLGAHGAHMEAGLWWCVFMVSVLVQDLALTQALAFSFIQNLDTKKGRS